MRLFKVYVIEGVKIEKVKVCWAFPNFNFHMAQCISVPHKKSLKKGYTIPYARQKVARARSNDDILFFGICEPLVDNFGTMQCIFKYIATYPFEALCSVSKMRRHIIQIGRPFLIRMGVRHENVGNWT